MATKTWQNGGVNNNYSTAGNWVEGSKPTTGDDVVISGSYNMSVDEQTADLKSWDMTGYTGTLSCTTTSIQIRVGPTGGSTGAIKLAGTITFNGLLVPVPAAGCTVNVNFNGLTLPGQFITSSGTGSTASVILLDNTTVTGTVTHQAGILKTDGASDNSGLSHTWNKFVSSGTGTRTLTLGTSTITINSAVSSVSWDTGTTTNMTLNAGTSLINFTHNAYHQANFGNGLTYYNVSCTIPSANSWELNSTTSTFNNFTITGQANKNNGFSIYNGNLTVNTFTANGNSATNRLLIRTQSSSTLGTARSIIAGTVSCSNVNFRDITGAGAGSWDLSAITGGSGDCGGNSGITFTTAATQTWDGTTGSWSDSTKWTSRVPLPQDDVVVGAFGGAGRTLTMDMPTWGKNVSFAGVTNSPTLTKSIAASVYGSFTLASGMTYTVAAYSTTFQTRTSSTLTCAGKNLYNVGFAMYGGTMTLQDALTASNESSSLSYGTLTNPSTYAVNLYDFSISNTTTRALNMGSGTWTVNRSTTNPWNATTTTGLTFDAGTSTLVKSAGTNFAGGGLAYYNVSLDNATTIQGSNTFSNSLALTSVGSTYTFTAGTTQTIGRKFTASGTSASKITLASSSSGVPATISSSSNIPCNLKNVTITDVLCYPGGVFFYGTGSSFTLNKTAHWKCDEASWNGTSNEVVDSSVNAKHGTSYGGANTTTGRVGNAGIFDGSNDYVSTQSVTLSNVLTLGFWLYWDAFSNDNAQAFELGVGPDGTGNGLTIRPNDSSGEFMALLSGNTRTRTETFTRPSAGAWHHYVFYFSKTAASVDIRVWVDRVEQSTTATQPGGVSTGVFTEAAYFMTRAGTSRFGAGKIDDIMILSSALADQALVDCMYYNAPYWREGSSSDMMRSI